MMGAMTEGNALKCPTCGGDVAGIWLEFLPTTPVEVAPGVTVVAGPAHVNTWVATPCNHRHVLNFTVDLREST